MEPAHVPRRPIVVAELGPSEPLLLSPLAALVCLLAAGHHGGGGAPASGDGTGAAAAIDTAASERAAHPLKATMVAESRTATPGGTVWLAVALEMEPDWHTYWPGENDTGAPIRLKWTVSEGWTVGDVQWPAPDRHVGGGDLLDYVLEGQRVLLVPVKAPAGAKAGDVGTVQLDIGWLVCKSTCIPGGATLQTTVFVEPASSESTPADAALFAAARARVPQPIPTQGPVTVKWEGDLATLSARGAKSLMFSVGLGSVLVVDPIKNGRADGDTLKLPLDLSDTERSALRGVLEVQQSGGKPPMFFAVDISKPAPLPGR